MMTNSQWLTICTLMWMLLLTASGHGAATHTPEALAAQPGASPSVMAAAVIPIDQERTKTEIAAMAKKLVHNGFARNKSTGYIQAPKLTAPHQAGSLKREDIADALNAVKMVRYLAGLPYENVSFTEELNSISQHGAVLLAATNQFTHNPAKSADMDSQFYALGYKGCSEANLYKGLTNISAAVLGFIADPGSGNIATAGHRRWILKPGSESFGIGYAQGVTSLYVYGGRSGEADTYVAWPSAGDFPIEYFVNSDDIDAVPAFPWSVNLGAAYSAPNRNAVTLTLTRVRDGKRWVFDKYCPQLGGDTTPADGMHFAVDDTQYGMGKAILFRPDLAALGTILDGDTFTVRIDGLTSAAGKPASLSYTIRFFSLQAEMGTPGSAGQESQQGKLAKSASVAGADASVVPYYANERGDVSVVAMSAVWDGAVVFLPPETAVYHYRSNRKSFSDTMGHWAAEPIAFAAAREIFLGVGGGGFRPDGSMSRGMFVTVLARLYGADQAAYQGAGSFSDVKGGEWYAWAVAWAQESGVVLGMDEDSFAPEAAVTREQMALMMCRWMAYAGYDAAAVREAAVFADDSAISDWSREAVYALRCMGVVNGKPGGVFDPSGRLTRGEACAVFQNWIEAVLTAA